MPDPTPAPPAPTPHDPQLYTLQPRSRRVPRRDWSTTVGYLGVVLVTGFVMCAVFAPWLAPFDPTVRAGSPFSPPSPTHPLGTNDVGQDLLSELIYGTRVSLLVGVAAAAAAILVGTAAGLVGGFFPRLGSVVMRMVDVVLILPFLPLLIVLAAFLGRSLTTTIAVIAALSWAPTARVIHGHVLSLRGRDYITAARTMGARSPYLIRRHVLPRTFLLAMGQFVASVSAAILLESSLSFLGLGDPLRKSWGSILYWAQVRGAFLTDAWLWWVLPPGLLIMLAALGFALLGFALEHRINPRLHSD